MTRDEAIHALKALEPEVRALGVTGLFLYGSTARDEARADSDIDIFVDYERGGRFSGWDIVGVQQLVEARLPKPCHVNTRNGLRRLMPYGVEADMVRVF